MRLRALSVVLALAMAPWHASRAQSPTSTTSTTAARQLLRLEDAWTTAVVKRDAAFFRRNLHPDYVYTDERGNFTKEQVLQQAGVAVLAQANSLPQAVLKLIG